MILAAWTAPEWPIKWSGFRDGVKHFSLSVSRNIDLEMEYLKSLILDILIIKQSVLFQHLEFLELN